MLKCAIFIVATFFAQILSAFFTKWLNINLSPSLLPLTPVTAYINAVEIFFDLFAFCLCGIWVYDLRRSSLMHKNLKVVCFLISFHVSTYCFFEIILIIDKFTNEIYVPQILKLIVNIIHGCSRMHFTLDPAVAVIERSLATLKVTNYEKLSSEKQWIILMFAKEIFGIAIFYFFTCTAIGAIAVGVIWIFLLIFTVIIGIILYRVNLRSYKTRIGTLHLTTRYQTVENIRCLKPVLIYSFLAVFENIISFFLLLLLILQFSAGNIEGGSITESFMNLFIAIFCIISSFSFLIYSSRIRKFVKNQLKSFRRSSVSSNTAPVLSVMGKVLTPKNEQNLYFNQLNDSWK